MLIFLVVVTEERFLMLLTFFFIMDGSLCTFLSDLILKFLNMFKILGIGSTYTLLLKKTLYLTPHALA